MKSLLLAFCITLAALCTSLFLFHSVVRASQERHAWAGRVEEREAGIARFDASEDGRRWFRHDDSSGNQKRQRDEELAYIVAMKAARDDAATRQGDASQLALSAAGVALIGSLALAIRGRQLWNRSAPQQDA